MKKLLLAILCLFSLNSFSQQTITHHEIEKDVKPAGKMELVYSNTGFPISDFFVNEKFMLLFSRYKQVFYLLNRKTGLIEDELHLKDIEGLIGGKYSFRLQHQKRKYDASYTSYLSGYSGVISRSLQGVNDTLLYCGVVEKKKYRYFNFYISFTKSAEINYQVIDNLAKKEDFVVPDVKYEIKFNRYYHSGLLGQYYYPENKYLILRNSPWERVENKFYSKTIKGGFFIYEKMEAGLYYPAKALHLPKSGGYMNMFFDNENIICYSKWNASEINIINNDSVMKTVDQPGVHYTNQFISDNKTNAIYLIADVRYKDFTDTAKMKRIRSGKEQMKKYYRQGVYNQQFKAYDIYEFEIGSSSFKQIHHVQITGQIAKYLNENVNEIGNSESFRMYAGELFLNIPVFSPDEQLGIFKINLDQDRDTTHISTYRKTEYKFIEFKENGWQSEQETMSMVNENEYDEMPGKFAKVLTGKRNYKNKSSTIEQLIEALKTPVQANPRQVPAQFIAYDSNSIGLMDYYHNTNNLQHAFDDMIPKWKQPLADMLTAIQIADKNVVVEQKGKLRHYTTPDGWHCAFVKINGYWYLYHQFHKFENYIIEDDFQELPVID